MDGANELLQFAEKLEPQRKIFRQVEHKTKLTVEWKKRTKQNEVIGRRLLCFFLVFGHGAHNGEEWKDEDKLK